MMPKKRDNFAFRLKPQTVAANPRVRERDIQAQIRDYLRLKGWFVLKIHQSLGSYPGVADLYALKNGVSVWIEVKTPTGRLSKVQEQFGEAVTNHGGKYLVARNLDDVIREVR